MISAKQFAKRTLFFTFLITTGAYANTRLELQEPSFEGGKALLTLSITESIRPVDYDNLLKAENLCQSRFHDKWALIVKLNSNGGNISTSLELGRFLRRRGALAVVEKGAHCFSSCVYVLAGAPSRAVNGKIGIHRPYEPNDQQESAEAQRTKYTKLEAKVLTYLKEVNIPASLYEDSIYISPERMKVLSDADLERYGLSANDPYTEEASAATQAKQLGISRMEYAIREARAKETCGLDTISDRTPSAEVVRRLECRVAVLKGRR